MHAEECNALSHKGVRSPEGSEVGGTVTKRNANLPSPGNPASVAPRRAAGVPRSLGAEGAAAQRRSRERAQASRDPPSGVTGGRAFRRDGRALAAGMEPRRCVLLALACPRAPGRRCGAGRAVSPAGEQRDRRCRDGAEAAGNMEAPEPGPRPGRAAAAAAEEHEPVHARAGGGVAAAEQDRPHVRGGGRRGHAGGVLRRRAPLSALLPGRSRRCPRAASWWRGRPRSLPTEGTGAERWLGQGRRRSRGRAASSQPCADRACATTLQREMP